MARLMSFLNLLRSQSLMGIPYALASVKRSSTRLFVPLPMHALRMYLMNEAANISSQRMRVSLPH